ncbi:hypothetical protein HanPI659440_Chr13g0524351 [Helianthus annuus]|nr:hypothetical protein HanIR_Chr13g0669991 [Helianthus annuus]KAJ0499804.1 hypothetical protein HanHA89_Chr13g0537981 [Helianthus annuus]KAJ0717523.1 hypothetical protein HanPI659440_Chr13g0524351 [Helianthus annuus]
MKYQIAPQLIIFLFLAYLGFTQLLKNTKLAPELCSFTFLSLVSLHITRTNFEIHS